MAGFRSKEDQIRFYMQGAEAYADDEPCHLCKGRLGDPPVKGCRTPYTLWHRCGKVHVRASASCKLRVGDCLLETSVEKARRLQVKVEAVPLDARKMMTAFRKLHDPKAGWELYPEFTIWRRRVDLLALRLYQFGPPIVIYETKVDRGDWLSELRNPDKRAEALEVSSEFRYIAPEGVIHASEVPDGCGLVSVRVGPRGAVHPEVVLEAAQRPVTSVPIEVAVRMVNRSMGNHPGRRF